MRRSRRTTDMSDDTALIERLLAAGQSVQPGHAEEGRERLLRAVAQRRATSRPWKERTPVFDLLLGKKRLAFIAAGVLAVGAAGAVGASGGVSDAAGNVNDVLAALNITDKTPDVADEHIDAIEQPGGAEDADASVNESANENASEGADNADDGINNSNASDEGLDHAADNASEGAGNADAASDGLPEQADERADGAPGTEGANVPDLPDAADDALDDVDPGVPADAPADDHADLPDEANDPPVPVP